MRRSLLLALALLAIFAGPGAADDGARFRRTTPRAALETIGGVMVLGVPAGRAWGIESDLRPLPSGGAILVRLAVADDDVREAFVRIAFYARASGRSRQIAVADSEAVGPGERRVVAVALDPPPGAVAYRVRVLARLRAGASGSRPDAIRASVTSPSTGELRFGSLLSRLLP